MDERGTSQSGVGNLLRRIQRALFATKEVPVGVIGLVSILALFLALGFRTYSVNMACTEVEAQYSKSLDMVSDISVQAEKEWKTLPLYDEKYYGDARTDNKQIYSTFEDFYERNYFSQSDSELSIGMRIVINNQRCFDSRTVAEAQDYLEG